MKILIFAEVYYPDVMGGGEFSTKQMAESLENDKANENIQASFKKFKYSISLKRKSDPMRKSAVDLWRKVHYTCDSEKNPCSLIGNRKKKGDSPCSH